MSFSILDYLKSSFLPQQQTGGPIGVGNSIPQQNSSQGQLGMDVSEAQRLLELTPEEQRAYALNKMLQNGGAAKGGGPAQNGQSMANQFINSGYSAYSPTTPDMSMFYQNKWSPPQISKLGRSI